MQYRGRFAPSPTGPLHFGSLVAALASYLEAKQGGGLWLLRIEDIDEPRTVKGSADGIVDTLEKYGFQWDDRVVYQSERKQHYRDALDFLEQTGRLYRCSCSRSEIQGIHSGPCQGGGKKRGQAAIRLEVRNESVSFTDDIQGHFSQNLAREVGDFVLLRADGFFAYQLAVVVDDFLQGITHVVRGADLLDSTPRQIYLQQLLGFYQPRYSHLPVALNANGEKLGKQTLAAPLTPKRPVEQLCKALRFLGQNIPDDLQDSDADFFWQWALANWDKNRIPGISARLTL